MPTHLRRTTVKSSSRTVRNWGYAKFASGSKIKETFPVCYEILPRKMPNLDHGFHLFILFPDYRVGSKTKVREPSV